MKQSAHLRDLIWSPQELVVHLSKFYHLMPGDIIFTGTPAGVGPVGPGDFIRGQIDGLAPVELTIDGGG
jgi:fumarylpyruvate hydrolase